MTTYKCTNSFTASNRIKYSYGSKISSQVYRQLPYSEQRNFTMVMDEDDSPSSSISSSLDNTSFDIPSYDSGSNDSSSSSDDGFGGFGGGDFGGGGASGDY